MAKQTTRAGMDVKEKMYLVLVLCFAAVLITVGAAFFIVRGLGSTTRQNDNTADSAATQEPLVADSSYDKNQNTIDTNRYSSTILEESADAGQSYVDETLFLGDSNTARMYRGGLHGNYCTKNNAIGSVGMAGKSLATYACVQFQGYSGYQTMAQAVALMQPRRVILTFGTNDLSSSYSASSFASDYAKGIKAVQDAYPSVDIIVNAIPPLGQQHSNQNLTQTQVDEYNKALVQMCQENDWKFLNSAEALKDASTGYAKSGYVAGDGIHLTEDGMDALFKYIRTHSYITEDDRPALTTIPTHTDDKDVSTGKDIVTDPSTTTATAKPQATKEPDAESGTTDGPDWADGTSGSYATATPEPEYTYWSEIIAPTCTEQGYTYYHCNKDSSKDYKSEYVNALGHDFQNGYCTRCGAQDPNAATQEPTKEPTATEAPAPDAPADSGTSGSGDTPDWASENSDSTPEA